MLNRIKIIAGTVLGLMLSIHVSAKTSPPGPIIGLGIVVINQTYTYSYDDGLVHPNPMWYVNKGTIESQIVSGTQYSVTILWTSTGSGSIEFAQDFDALLATKSITINACANPSTPSVTFSLPSSTCSPRALSYTGTPPADVTYYWQTTSTGTSTSNSTNSYSVTATGTYYVRARNTGGCWSTSSASYAVSTVTAPPATPAVPTVSTNTCGDKTLTRGTPPSGVVFYWQGTDPNGTSASSSATTYAATTTGTYYLRAYNSTSGCWSAGSASVSVTVTPLPSAPTGTPATRCGSGTVTLTATPGANGNTVKWYSALNAGTLLATATSYTTPSISTTTTYYITSFNSTTGCESGGSRIAVAATVGQIPGSPTATTPSATICASATATLTATAGANGNSVRWYSASTGGTLLFTGTSFTTPALSATTTYYISSFNTTTNCESTTARIAIPVTVNPQPATPTGVDGSRCGSGTVTLTATPPAGTSVKWYAAASGGTALATSNSYTTPSLTSTKTYYVCSVASTGCESNRVPVTATINVKPTEAIVNSLFTRCGPGSVTLSGTPGENGNTLKWYGAAGPALGTGLTFTTPVLNTYTVYWVSSYNTTTGCESVGRMEVEVMIMSDAITAGTIGTDKTICTGTSPGTLTSVTAGTGTGTVSYKWEQSANGTDWSEIIENGSSATYTPGELTSVTYYRRKATASGSCGVAYSNQVTISIDAPSVGGAVGPNASFVLESSSPATGSVTLTGQTGSVQKWQKKDAGSWVDIANVQNTFSYSLSKTTSYRVEVKNGACPVSYSTEATITITNTGAGLYNGTIASSRWHTNKAFGTEGTDLSGMYVYKYDEKYQISEARWADVNHSLKTFSMAGNRNKVGNTYDPNGNILTMLRHNPDGSVKNNFGYTYAANKNQLTSVSGYTTLYEYNKIGQMTSANKTAETDEDQYVEYDVSGKVVKVFSDAAKTNVKVVYEYDDRGFRLAKKTYDTNGTTVKLTTWYIRDASGNILSVYEQKPAQDIVQKEVPVYGSGKLGTMYPEQQGRVGYEITDHLGNVRALVKEEDFVYTATMEDTDVEDLTNPRVQELVYFENLFETEVADVNMNHTSPTATIVSSPNKSAYLYWVSGVAGMDAQNKSIGPAMALKVSPGDVIDAEAFVRYREEVSYTRSGFTLGVLSTILGNNFAMAGGFEGVNATQTSQAFNNALTSGGFLADGVDDTRPYAYLNYIVLDANFNQVKSGWKRVTEAAEFSPGEEGLPNMHENVKLSAVTIGATGRYIYVWVSNESQGARVWFDDVKVTQHTALVQEATDYGVWGDVLAEQKADESKKYRFGYQGNFAEKDEETGWNHFEAREYDPIIGRWTSLDPDKQYASGYKAHGNNPVSMIDHNGKWASKWGFYVHQYAIQYALWHKYITLTANDHEYNFDKYHKLYAKQREILIKATVYADSEQFQDGISSFRHAMTNAGQTKIEARDLANAFVRNQFEKAFKLREENKEDEALFEFGVALHVLQDATSPAHAGFQEWGDKPGFFKTVGHALKELFYPGWKSNLQKVTNEALEWYDKGCVPEGDLFKNIKADK